MTVHDMDIPYPSQHTLSGNHRPASDMPFKMFRCCIAKREERKAGGGVGDRLESPVENPFNVCGLFFFACVVVVFYGLGGGGVNC